MPKLRAAGLTGSDGINDDELCRLAPVVGLDAM